MNAQSDLVNETLGDFRARHPSVTLTVGGVRWEYIACGAGDQTVLVLVVGFLVHWVGQ